MSLFHVLDTAGSALTAQSVRLNLTASNLANAETLAGSAADSYRGRYPVFATVLGGFGDGRQARGVEVTDIVEGQAPAPRHYRPDHPLADGDGYVFGANVNPIEEMADMIAASRAYQNNVEVMNTSKDLVLRTLAMGR